MKVTSSYAVEIKKQRMFDDTIKLYREAVSFLIGCFNKEWLTIQSVDKAKAKFNFAEKLVHTTKHNTAKYDFDAKFYIQQSKLITLPYEFDLPDGVDPDDFDAVVDYLYNETGCIATAYRYNRDSSVEPNDPYWDFN